MGQRRVRFAPCCTSKCIDFPTNGLDSLAYFTGIGSTHTPFRQHLLVSAFSHSSTGENGATRRRWVGGWGDGSGGGEVGEAGDRGRRGEGGGVGVEVGVGGRTCSTAARASVSIFDLPLSLTVKSCSRPRMCSFRQQNIINQHPTIKRQRCMQMDRVLLCVLCWKSKNRMRIKTEHALHAFYCRVVSLIPHVFTCTTSVRCT